MRQHFSHFLASLSLIALVLLGSVIMFASGEIAASVTLTSTTAEGAQIAKDETVSYLLSVQITGITYGTPTPVSIALSNISTYFSCTTPASQTVQSSGLVPFEVKCQVQNSPPAGTTITSPTFVVTLDGKTYSPVKPYGSFVIASGVDMAGESTDQKFDLFAVQHPNRILNGSFDFGESQEAKPHPREDGKDKTQTEISIYQPAHVPELGSQIYVYPYELYSSGATAGSTNGRLITQNNPGTASYDACAGYSGPWSCSPSSCRSDYVMDLPKQAQVTSLGGGYDIPDFDGDVSKSMIIFYNPTEIPSTQLDHLNQLTSGQVVTSISVLLPEKNPHLFFPGSTADGPKTMSYDRLFHIYSTDSELPQDMNEFMRKGGQYTFPKDHWEERAIETGRSGEVVVNVAIPLQKTQWRYQKIREDTFPCTRTINAQCSDGLGGLTPCPESEIVWKPKPVFKWVQFGGTEILPNDADPATATVDVYSSTAWVQTKGGNLGTNDDVKLATGLESSRFRYGSGEEIIGDKIGSDATGTYTQAGADLYTPRNQSNADFMIFAPAQSKNIDISTSLTSLISKSNWYHTIKAEDFLRDPTKQGKESQRYGYGLRGEEYDRDTFKRDFPNDLLQHEIFGKVTELTEPGIAGVSVVGTNIAITGTFNLERGVIYHVPSGYTLTLGDKDHDLRLTGSSARIQADGGVITIAGNIVYGSHSAVSYLDVPNLRIDAGDSGTITIAPHVEYIESQLRAGTLSTGASEHQLRILGDVIAGTTNFQRSPVNVYDPENYEKNPPSELIIEDLRKYVVPAPGDTTLRTSDSTWGQVNPETGESIDPY